MASNRRVVAIQPTLDLGGTMAPDTDRVSAVISAQNLDKGDVIEQPRPQPILRVERTSAEGHGRVRVVFADGTSRWYAANEPVMVKVQVDRLEERDTVSTMPGKTDRL